jgi:magnesium transporter
MEASEQLQYLSKLPHSTTRVVFGHLNPDTAADLIPRMDKEMFTDVFSVMDTHKAARLLSRVTPQTVHQKLSLLSEIRSREIKHFLHYPEDTAGGLMETNVVVFRKDNSVKDVLSRIRKLGDRRIAVVFVLGEDDTLIGKVPLQVIAISKPSVLLGSLMEPAPAVPALAPREEVLQIMDKEQLLQVPVIDINNQLLGIIRNDALMTATKQEITENLQAMFGAGREEHALSKVSFAVKKRLPWLQVNLATAFLASLVVGLFEDTIARITILAVFLPVVAGQSGNTGSQALAVTMRGLALREIRISQWFRVARKEIMVGFINGLAVAVTTGIIVFFWANSLGIAVVIGISMVLSMIIAGLSGAVIPMILKAVGQDPATSSSIILTTVTDICGFLSFLGLATALSGILGIN